MQRIEATSSVRAPIFIADIFTHETESTTEEFLKSLSETAGPSSLMMVLQLCVTKTMERAGDKWIRVIALFKLVKALLLIIVAIGVLKLLHRDVAQVIEYWINLLQVDPDNRYIQNMLRKLWFVDDRKLKEISAGTFCYATLFLIEGTGLFLRKRWAEYFTIVVTASLLPFEIYEMVQEPSVVKAAVIIINIAIVVYLIVRLRFKPNRKFKR
jgi:uncharacterized membrane protein (DUF2068 family)